MKKMFMVVFLALLIGGIASTASANLINNPGFEDFSGGPGLEDFDYWGESGIYGATDDYVHSGDWAAYLTNTSSPPNSQLKSSRFDITETGMYEYGTWFKCISNVDPATLSWPADRPGVTASILINDVWSHDATIVSINQDLETAWTRYDDGDGEYYVSDWFLLGGTFDVSAVGKGEMIIYLQEYNANAFSVVVVDDAFMQRVPEPATMLLLGFGLIGLVGFRRKA